MEVFPLDVKADQSGCSFRWADLTTHPARPVAYCDKQSIQPSHVDNPNRCVRIPVLVSEMADYWMALQIVREAFRETLGQQSQETLHRIDFIREKGPIQYNALATEWGVSKAALTAWVRGRIYDNLLAWCNEDGYEFVDEKDLKRAKHSGVAYLKVNDNFTKEDRTGLPSPFELTADPRWNESGDLFKLYDLELDQRSHVSSSQPVQKPEFKFSTFELEEESEDIEPDINRASSSLADLGIQTFYKPSQNKLSDT